MSEPRSPITTHVLDTARGKPAAGLGVVLELKDRDHWIVLARTKTDADGRALGLLPADHGLTLGTYRLTFLVGPWQEGFFPEVAVTFRITDPEEHYHVPLLLSPFGYSTYRGS
jgi:5-hydroxyisourate hydrolase